MRFFKGEKISKFIEKSYDKIRANKKDEVIECATEIMKRKQNGISYKKAIALAVTCIIAGIPIGYALPHPHNKPEKGSKVVSELGSEKCEVKKGEVFDASLSDITGDSIKIFYNYKEIGQFDLDDVDIYNPFSACANVNLRAGASQDDAINQVIGNNDIVYIKDSDENIYNYNDIYDWKKAIYEKDGVYYYGYIALDNSYFDNNPIKKKNSIMLEVKEDTYITGMSESAKKEFEKRAVNINKEPDREDNTNNEANNEFSYYEDTYFDIYKALPDESHDRNVVYGYEDVKINDEDIKKISNWLKSWENPGLYEYIAGLSDNYDGNPYVNQCITRDKKQYICYIDGLGYGGDNGARNYGFGVNINQWGIKNEDHVAILEEKYGYNLEDQQLLNPGISVIPVEYIDEAKEYYIKQRIEDVKECLEKYNIKFSKSEILAAAAIGYQCGRGRIPNLIENYAMYGNSKDLRQNFEFHGNNPFLYAEGVSVYYEGYNIGRSFAYWKAFHDGKLIMAGNSGQVVELNTENEMVVNEEEMER